MKEQSRNMFKHQTSCQHIFQNTQPFSVIQSLKCSWQGDLAKAYHGFANEEIRKLTKSEVQ